MKKKIIICVAVFLTAIVAFFSVVVINASIQTIKRAEVYADAMSEFNDVINQKSSQEKITKMKELADDIKSENEYAVIEKAAKKYACDVFIPFEEAAAIQDDSIYSTGISIELIQNDAPDFAKPYRDMELMEAKLSKIQEVIDNLFERDAAMAYLEGNVSDSFVSTYEEEVNDTYNDMELKQSYIDYVDTLRDITVHYRKILDFLVANNGKWHLEGDAIAFKTIQLTNEYNSLVDELKKFSN